MTQVELAREIARQCGTTIKDTSLVISTMTDIIKETVNRGETVKLHGLGNFEKRHRKATRRFDNLSGKVVDVEACNIPYFKVSETWRKNLKNRGE